MVDDAAHGRRKAAIDRAGPSTLPIVPDEQPAIDITPGSSNQLEDHRRRPSVSSAPASGQRTRRVAPAALLALVALVTAVVIWALTTGDGEGAAATDPVNESASDAALPAVSTATAGVDERDGQSTQPDSDSVARLFGEWVDNDRRWAVVYPSPMGLQVLDASGTTQPQIEVAAGFKEAAQLPLISDGSRSWAVDPTRPGEAWLVSTQFVVTDIDQDGRVAFINDRRDPPNIGESSFGAWGPGFDLPPDAEVLAVPGRGLFVLPDTGGTFKYLVNSVEQVSDDRLVAASVDSEIFERCDAQLSCELYLVDPDETDELRLDVPVGSEVWLSPGGRWVVVTAAGVSTLVEPATGIRRPLDVAVQAADWSDDASVVALLGRSDLVVVRIDEMGEVEQRSVTLPVAPSAAAVLLLTR